MVELSAGDIGGGFVCLVVITEFSCCLAASLTLAKFATGSLLMVAGSSDLPSAAPSLIMPAVVDSLGLLLSMLLLLLLLSISFGEDFSLCCNWEVELDVGELTVPCCCCCCSLKVVVLMNFSCSVALV